MIYEHPFYNLDTFKGQKNVDGIQGLNNTFYCGAYLGYGFHEDGINSALKVSKLIER
jgi:predicted NAD/FAD-binding protein